MLMLGLGLRCEVLDERAGHLTLGWRGAGRSPGTHQDKTRPDKSKQLKLDAHIQVKCQGQGQGRFVRLGVRS